MRFRRSLGASTLLFVMLAATPARAQLQSSPSPADSNDEAPSFGQLFTRTLGNFGRLPSVDNLEWLTVGGAAALATHPADADATRVLANAGALHEPFKAGAFLGGGPFELGAAFATYGVGRALHNGRAARVGADLIQAQLMAESRETGGEAAAAVGLGILVSVRPHDSHVCIGDGPAAAFRLEDRYPGVCGRVVCRDISHSAKASLPERCGLRRGARDDRWPDGDGEPSSRARRESCGGSRWRRSCSELDPPVIASDN